MKIKLEWKNSRLLSGSVQFGEFYRHHDYGQREIRYTAKAISDHTNYLCQTVEEAKEFVQDSLGVNENMELDIESSVRINGNAIHTITSTGTIIDDYRPWFRFKIAEVRWSGKAMLWNCFILAEIARDGRVWLPDGRIVMGKDEAESKYLEE